VLKESHRAKVADPQKRETDSASVAGEIFSPAPAAPADRRGLCPFELCRTLNFLVS
jgi:hypothetical protein